MKVELIQATPNPVKLITDVASICYGHEEAKYPDKLLKHLNEGGHHSVFEHVWFTFKIEGISRACLAQLTRHRHASFTVRSQRYCNEEDTDFAIPGFTEEYEQYDVFNDALDFAIDSYNKLIELGMKREDARFILPEATQTELYISLNLRELVHIYKLRTSKQAQWEIRNLTNYMVSLIPEELKVLF